MARGIQVKRNKIMSTNAALERYINACKIKNLTPNTIKTYQLECKQFIEWCGAELQMCDVTEETVNEYINYLFDSGKKKPVSIATCIRQIRAFLYWCMKQNYLQKFNVELPKYNETLKEPYTESELLKLLTRPKSDATWAEYRNWCMVNYLIATGNRISTAANLKISDVDFKDGYIKLRQLKNRKVEIIPMSEKLKEVLEEYLSLWDYNESDYLFPSYEGGRLLARSAAEAIAKYNQSRNVEKTSCHLFRHNFAKQYLMAGGVGSKLQRLLGHSSYDVTRRYVNLYANDLKIGYDNLNPLDNILKK